MATMKASNVLATGSVSSLRVKPFTALVRPTLSGRPAVRPARAAAVDAETEDLDFAFNFSDAKKANDYSTSDVEAAMRFYESAEGPVPMFDQDFVANPFGMEDASFFDDMDNEEAYIDEFIVAGIPEAAPKKRGRGRQQGAGQEDDDDDVEQAKALDKVKALEDRMVMEAALEEEFGADGGLSLSAESTGTQTGVWDWLTDIENKESSEVVEAAPVDDRQTTRDIANAGTEVDEVTTAYLELFSTDDLTDDVLAALNEADEPVEAVSTITDEELARVDAVINEEIPVLELKRIDTSEVARLDDSPALQKDVVDQYIASLRAVVSSGSRATESEVKELFGDEPLTVEAADAPEDAAATAETQELLAAKEPEVPAAETFDFTAEVSAIEDASGELAEDDDGGLERELRALAAIEELTETDFALEDADMATLENYVVAGEDFVAQEENRKAVLAAAVARGELSPDALAEELEDLPDAVDELLAEGALAEDDGPDMAFDEENDSEQWQERILELTRVTKVVKGGKIMGFRCVAVIGNQNGLVGVGCQAGREVAVAVKRTLVDARRNVVRVPLVGAGTVPHRSEAKYHAARCVVVPASDGTGCIAGGSVRSVLELAGVKNCLAKRIGSRSALNSARATVRALQQMQSLKEVSQARGVPMEQLLLPQ